MGSESSEHSSVVYSLCQQVTVSQAYFALHKTLQEIQNFQEKDISWHYGYF